MKKKLFSLLAFVFFIWLGLKAAPTVYTDKYNFTNAENSEIKLHFSEAPKGTSAWIGIFYHWDEPGVGAAQVQYTASTNDIEQGVMTVSCKDRANVMYYAVMFGDAGFTKEISPRVYFRISNRTELADLSANKNAFNVGEPITVNYAKGPGAANDWIAVYSISEQNNVKDGGATSLVYKYVPSTEGQVVFDDLTKLVKGKYFISYLEKDGYLECAKRFYFSIGGAPIVSSNVKKGIVGGKENLIFTASSSKTFQLASVKGYPSPWFVIKNSQGKEVLRQAVTAITALGKANIQIGALPAGKYTAEFQNYDQTQSELLPFEVLLDPVLMFNSNAYLKDEQIKLSYKNAPEGTDAWVALYYHWDVPGVGGQSQFSAKTEGSEGTFTFPASQIGDQAVKLYAYLFYDENNAPLPGTTEKSPYIVLDKKPLFINTKTAIGKLELTKKRYEVDEPIIVDYSGGPGRSMDWIAIFRVGARLDNGAGDYVRDAYVNENTQGRLNFAGLAKGAYFVAYMVEDGYVECSNRVYFTVGEEGPTVTTDKKNYAEQEEVTFNIQQTYKYSACWVLVKDEKGVVVDQIFPDVNFAASSYKNFAKYSTGKYTADLVCFLKNPIILATTQFEVGSQVGIDAIENSLLQVYPNPVVGTLYMQGENGLQVDVYNLTGQKVLSQQLFNGSITMESLPAGIYQVNVGNKTIKIVKK